LISAALASCSGHVPEMFRRENPVLAGDVSLCYQYRHEQSIRLDHTGLLLVSSVKAADKLGANNAEWSVAVGLGTETGNTPAEKIRKDKRCLSVGLKDGCCVGRRGTYLRNPVSFCRRAVNSVIPVLALPVVVSVVLL
jgi:hypothetical protein